MRLSTLHYENVGFCKRYSRELLLLQFRSSSAGKSPSPVSGQCKTNLVITNFPNESEIGTQYENVISAVLVLKTIPQVLLYFFLLYSTNDFWTYSLMEVLITQLLMKILIVGIEIHI